MRFKATLGERGVAVPGDPKAELGGARAPVAGTVNGTPFRGRLMVYGGVAYLGFRKEYATWIAEAKKDETRERRVQRALEMLRGGTKHP